MLFSYQVKSFKDWMRLGVLFHDDGRWAFRGHMDSSWDLSSTLERAIGDQSCDGAIADEFESAMLRQFQRRAHNYSKMLPEKDNTVEWLAMMQHFGSPTRLLDFTHSFYVASFFCFGSHGNHTNACIWSINRHFIYKQVLRRHEERNDNVSRLHALWDPSSDRMVPAEMHNFHLDEAMRVFAERPNRNEKPGVIFFEPMSLNVRMARQQGLFLMPRSIDKPFIYNLRSDLDVSVVEVMASGLKPVDTIHKRHLQSIPGFRIDICPDVMQQIRRHLKAMNILHETLFGDFDSLARGMGWFIDSDPRAAWS